MRLIKLKQVMDLTSLSRSAIYKFMQEERFPKQVRLSPTSVAWVEGEVEDWIEEKIFERDEQA